MTNKTRFQNSHLLAFTMSCFALTTASCTKSDSLGSVGNDGGGEASSGPSDTIASVFCQLSDGRKVPAGAAYAAEDGCNCCVCTSSGVGTCQAAACTGATIAASPGNCQSDEDCRNQGRSLCVFDQGCDSPRGTCMSGPGICPTSYVSDLSPFQYCGCDGVTYAYVNEATITRLYPYKPYRHYGACGPNDRTDGGPGAPDVPPDVSPGSSCQYPTGSALSDAGEVLWSWYFNWTSASPNLASMCAAWGADAKMILEVMVPASTTGTGTTLPICTSEAITTGSGAACSVADTRRFEAPCTDGHFLFQLPSTDTIDAYYHLESTNYPNSRRWTVNQAVEGCVRTVNAIPGGPAQAYKDGGADSAPDGAVDMLPNGPDCGAGAPIFYPAPGCGTAAVSTCARAAIDAKYSPSLYCGCDGVTTLTYDQWEILSPYLYAGACNPDGGTDVVPPGPDGGAPEVRTTSDLAGDNVANPCAACTANQVCVQSFDGTCHTSGVACKTVSDTCRTKLLASGATTCSTLSECESEFCASPYRCIYSSPCGTEAPQAALYCYGP